MSLNNKKPCFDVSLENSISLIDFVGYFRKQGPFAKKLLKFIVKNCLSERFVTQEGEILSVFYGSDVNVKPKNVYIDKRAIRHFVKKYEKELENLGICSDCLKAVIFDVPCSVSEKEDLLPLWGTLAKITPNTKCVTDLCKYVKDNFLEAEYPSRSASGHMTMEKMFVFLKGKAGRTGFGLKKEAYPFFIRRYKDVLIQEVKRLDSQTNVIGIRGLLREFGVVENIDVQVKEFIVNNCLNDTFEVKNEQGNIQVLPCFSFEKYNAFSIDKRCLPIFAKRYEKELLALGIKNVTRVFDLVPRLTERKTLYSVSDLAEMLRCPDLKEKMNNFITEKGLDYFKISAIDGNKIPVFQEYYFHDKRGYYFLKSHLTQFLKEYKEQLMTFGVREELLLDRSGVQKIRFKDDEMIVFDDFYLALTTDARFHKELTQKIKTLMSDETYSYKDENGVMREEKVFDKVRSGVVIAMVFKNDRAMKAFVSKNREFLMKNGIKKEAIEHYLEEKKVIEYSDEYIPIREFPKIFHQSTKDILKVIHEKYLDETYETVDEAGTIVQKSVFQPVQHNGKGMIFYAVPKEALLPFALKHKEELKISPLVIDELSGKIKVVEKTDDYIIIPDLFKGFWKDSRRAIAIANQFIVKHCMNDMYLSENEAGTLVSKPLFQYARNKASGHMGICIDINGVETFLRHRGPELKKMGIYPWPFIQKVQETKLPMKKLILDRLKMRGRI